MPRLATRLSRVECINRQRSETARAAGRALNVRLACAHLACQPDLELVRAKDTDPETFRSILETLAWARQDYAEAGRLAALKPPPEPRQPPPWAKTGTKPCAAEWVNWALGDHHEFVRASKAREGAVERARRRTSIG